MNLPQTGSAALSQVRYRSATGRRLPGVSMPSCACTRAMSPAAASVPEGVAAADGPGDSVDVILGEWADQRADLDFSAMAVVTRLARVHAHPRRTAAGRLRPGACGIGRSGACAAQVG
jgi:hypothetical protein